MTARMSHTMGKVIAALLIVMVVLSAIPASPVFADTSGPNYPTVGSSIFGTSDPWANPGNITADDNQYAVVDFSIGMSEYLHGTSFGFSIPSNATINGIELTIGRYSELTSYGGARDLNVNLLKAGVIAGVNRGHPYQGEDWPATETARTYGGPTDLWGTTWTAAEINDAGFGGSLRIVTMDYVNAYVDYFRITVTYNTNGTTLEATAVSGIYGDPMSLSATISPVLAGKTITFSLNGTAACSSTTDTSGVATCPANLKINAGAYPAGVSASFAGDLEYGPSTDTASLTVSQRAITVTAVTDTKTYDGTAASSGVPTRTSGTLASGDTESWTQTFNNKNAGSGKTLTPSGTVSDGNGGANYNVTFTPVATGVINQLAVTVTAAASTKTYDGTTASSGVPSVSPALASGDTATWTQVFNNKNAGSSKTLTPSGTVSDGNGGANYSVTFTPVATGVINQRAVTVTAAASTKTYDGTTASSGVPTVSPALASGDTATWIQVYNNKNAGSGKTLTPSGTVSDGNGGANYNVTFAPVATGVINQLAVTVTAAADTKTYDGTASSSGVPTVSPALASGDTAAWIQVYNNKNAGSGKTLTPSGTVSDGNGGANYSVTFSPVATGVINQRAITVTAATDTKTYDGTAASSGVPTRTSGAIASGDSESWTQTFNNKNAGSGKTLTPSGTVSDGNGGANYNVTFTPVATGVINQRAVTVTAATDTKTYDGTTTSSGVPARTSGTIASGDSESWTQVFDNKNAGSGKTLTPTGTVSDGNGGANYNVTFVTNTTGVINQRAITVTAEAKSKPFGGVEPALTYITNPALFGSDVLAGALTRAAGETVGVYPITQGTLLGGTNYTITLFTGANFTITLASQTITVNTHAPVKASNGDTFTVAATSSSGLAVTYSASGGCTNVGATFTMTSSTTDCVVHYNQAGNANFSPAPEITEIVAAADAPVVTLQPVNAKVFPGQNATFSAAASGTPTPTVQWQVSTDGGLTFNNLTGEISTTLTITTPPAGSNGYQYRAVFTNTSGVTNSNPAKLYLLYQILQLPVIIK